MTEPTPTPATRPTPPPNAPEPGASEPAGPRRLPHGAGAYAAAVCLLIAAAVGFTAYIESVGIRLEKKPIYPESGLTLASLPQKLPAYDPVWTDTGRREPVSKEIEEALGTSNHTTRFYEYQGPRDEPLIMQLHAAYYTGLIDTVPHVPERCFVGGGLRQVPNSAAVVDVPLNLQRLIPDRSATGDSGPTIYTARGIDIPNRVRLPRGVDNLKLRVTEFTAGEDQSVFAGYFFVANGGIVTSAEQVRFQAFELKQDYAYYMKVQFMSTQVDSPEELARYAGSMLDELFGELMLRCPDWIKVERGEHAAQQNTDADTPDPT